MPALSCAYAGTQAKVFSVESRSNRFVRCNHRTRAELDFDGIAEDYAESIGCGKKMGKNGKWKGKCQQKGNGNKNKRKGNKGKKTG